MIVKVNLVNEKRNLGLIVWKLFGEHLLARRDCRITQKYLNDDDFLMYGNKKSINRLEIAVHLIVIEPPK